MLAAIEHGLASTAQLLPGQPRDDLGRFATKPPGMGETPLLDAQPQNPAEQVPVDPGAKPQPDTIDELLKEPEGLAPKSSERFQKLANTVRDLQEQVGQREEKLQQQDQVLSYVKETFQANSISADQFEQAAQVLGALNRGDFDAAERVLVEQLQQIAIARGRPVASVDALAQYPDLRNQVDQLLISEEHALQLARVRQIDQTQAVQRQSQQREQQEQQQRQEQEQANQQRVNGALKDIDAFTRDVAARDMDWPVIEAKLLPRIQGLLSGVPPSQWLNVVKTQYELIKDVSAGSRGASAPSAGQVLRATGQGAPAAAPRTMFDAMWGGR